MSHGAVAPRLVRLPLGQGTAHPRAETANKTAAKIAAFLMLLSPFFSFTALKTSAMIEDQAGCPFPRRSSAHSLFSNFPNAIMRACESRVLLEVEPVERQGRFALHFLGLLVPHTAMHSRLVGWLSTIRFELELGVENN
jgi:hypothetical protein